MKRDDQDGGKEAKEAYWEEIDYDDITLGERIGGGGVGIVYQGWLGRRPVALKTLFDPRVDEGLKKEFMDELLVMSRLRHHNIVSIIGACVHPPHMFFVMELCQESVFNLLHGPRGRQLGLRQQLEMALDVARAMDYLHSLKPAIIHRDLKTHNLLIAADGTVKLCDFGLVRTRTTTAGTPNYMSPELLDNKPFNKTVDVYAFGIVLHEVMTCEVFLDGYDVYDIKRKVLAGERPKPPTVDCPSSIASLMQQCWHHDPAERPDFNEIVYTLEDAIEGLPAKTSLQELEEDTEGDALDGLMSVTSPGGSRRK